MCETYIGFLVFLAFLANDNSLSISLIIDGGTMLKNLLSSTAMTSRTLKPSSSYLRFLRTGFVRVIAPDTIENLKAPLYKHDCF